MRRQPGNEVEEVGNHYCHLLPELAARCNCTGHSAQKLGLTVYQVHNMANDSIDCIAID